MTANKQLKKDARALAAAEGISYQEALFRLDPARGDRQLAQQAGTVDLDRIARDLAAVWNRGRTVDPWPYDPYDDPNAEPCTGHGSCRCDSCLHTEHRETRKCRVVVPTDGQPYAWCAKPALWRVIPICIHSSGVIRQGSDGDPDADKFGSVTLGDNIQRDTWTQLYACSTQHARQLMNDTKQKRDRGDWPGQGTGWFYEVEPYVYQPDVFDVSTPLHLIESHADSITYWAKAAARALFDGDRKQQQYATEAVLSHLASAVGRAAQIGQQPPAENDEDDYPNDPGYYGRPVDDPDGEAAALTQEHADHLNELGWHDELGDQGRDETRQ
ncbi:hypothetical protein [Actinoplanes sp. NBRC 101535]|uniref:hypothetical protein n=1 Tax=Actinoplanes sp. NBRC 101535 TaxID=3032196 RepID=UPI0024A1503B|nr:hypothetical protein [Actinoplanes sp. NBRC 101535]GLY08255.1 hypothetical protein Acsp01_86340 [Actinoplanes sp. NBRC 101535]